MAWPSEAGIFGTQRVRRPRRRKPGPPPILIDPSAWRTEFQVDLRGRYRIFNAAEYRLYEETGGSTPAEGDTPLDTNATLPHEPTDTHADGEWRFALSYFNGVIDSGFYPVGTRGESYARMDISSSAEVVSPPAAPDQVELILRPNGVVRIRATYSETVASGKRANTWAIAYTTDGSTPAESSPDATQAFTSSDGFEQLEYDLPSQANGTTVKVRVQSYRSGDTTYSEGSTVLTATADAAGPSAPSAGRTWAGQLPEDL